MQASYFNDSSMFNHYPFEQNEMNGHHNVNYGPLNMDLTGNYNYNQLPAYTATTVTSNNDHDDAQHSGLNQNYYIQPFTNQLHSYTNETVANSTMFYEDSTTTTTPLAETPINYTFNPTQTIHTNTHNVHHDGLISFQLSKPINDYDQYNSFPVISTDYSSESCSTPQSAQMESISSQTISAVSHSDNSINAYPFPSPTSKFSPLGTPLASPSSTRSNHSHYQLNSPTSPKKLSSKFSSNSSTSRRSSVVSNKISKTLKKKSASASMSTTSSTITTTTSDQHFKQSSQHTTQPGPIPASKPKLSTDPTTGEELLTFSYSKQKIIKNFTIKCPPEQTAESLSKLSQQFLLDNCVYPRAMCSMEEYKGNRYQYEKECNEIGWNLAWLNTEIRDHRGLIQRAVDSWRNTRTNKKLRSRRVRKYEETN